MNALDAVRRLAEYMSGARKHTFLHVGDGPYGLVQLQEGGGRRLVAAGFGTVEDAEAYGAWSQRHAELEQRVAVGPHLQLAPSGIGVIFQVGGEDRVAGAIIGYEVVTFAPAVSAAALERMVQS